VSETKNVDEDVSAWKLTQHGDLDISDNGVIRTIEGRGLTTYQSANGIVGTQKGSFPFVPDMGIDIQNILGFKFGEDSISTFEYMYELLTQTELMDQDPYIIAVNQYEFVLNNVNRSVSIRFNITVSGGFEFQTEVQI
jgi:hypothetical protein